MPYMDLIQCEQPYSSLA